MNSPTTTIQIQRDEAITSKHIIPHDDNYRIDTNPGAQRLYERLGFREEKTEQFEFLRGILGFGASTTMTLKL